MDRDRVTPPRKPANWEEASGKPVRAMILLIRVPMLLEYLSGGHQLIGIPPGAQMVTAWMESRWERGNELRSHLALRIEHASFPVVEPGRKIPVRHAMFRRIMKAAANG